MASGNDHYVEHVDNPDYDPSDPQSKKKVPVIKGGMRPGKEKPFRSRSAAALAERAELDRERAALLEERKQLEKRAKALEKLEARAKKGRGRVVEYEDEPTDDTEVEKDEIDDPDEDSDDAED